MRVASCGDRMGENVKGFLAHSQVRNQQAIVIDIGFDEVS